MDINMRTLKERKEEWQDFLQSRSNVGLMTIMYMQMQSHDNPSLMISLIRLKVCYLLLLVIVAQLMIPVLLLMYSVDNSEIEIFCPSSADGISRAVAFALGCIYQVRIMLLLGSKPSESAEAKEGKATLRLQLSLLFDSFMNFIYELCVYFINLWIVFVTSDPLNMVLNALALEFVLQLDDVAKERYIAIFAKHHQIFQRYKDTFKPTPASPPEEEPAVAATNVYEGDGADADVLKGEGGVVDVPKEGDVAAVDVPKNEEGVKASGEKANICDLINYVVVLVVAQFVLPILTLFYLPICKPQ
jgi:hypothetical protein